jgi:hypothetical protein
MQGFTWNGKPTSIQDLANILQIPPDLIMANVAQLGSNMGSLATPENIKSTLETIITLSTSWAIQDRGHITQQLSQLLTSQDGKYKPFITAEVNKSLKLMLESNKNLMDTYKTFFTTTSYNTNILNITQDADPGKGEEYLSPDDALNMLQGHDTPAIPHKIDSGPAALSSTSKLADQLHDEYRIGDLESVKENRTGTEALIAPGPPDDKASGPSKGTHAHKDALVRRGILVADEDAEVLPDD